MSDYISVFNLVMEIIDVCRENDVAYELPVEDKLYLRDGFSKNPEVFFGIPEEKMEEVFLALDRNAKENRVTEKVQLKDGWGIKYSDCSTTLINLKEMDLAGSNGFNVTIVPMEKVNNGTKTYNREEFLISEDLPYPDISFDEAFISNIQNNSNMLERSIDENRAMLQKEGQIENSAFEDAGNILDEQGYLVTVIMAVYNTEDYLSEAIDSLLCQTIGFNRIQLVMINDGSTDSSYEICKKYKEKYSDNIILINQENKGVSATKNAGLEQASGKYTAFLDSDDVLPDDYFEKALSFFEAHKDEIDCLSTKIKIFGAKEYNHSLNFKYDGNKVVSIIEKPDYIITATGNVIYKTDMVKKYRFNKEVGIGEDILFNTMFMMEREKYGLVSSTEMHYRKREDGTSISGDNYHNKKWYQVLPKKVLIPLVEESMAVHGCVTKYVQEVVASWCRYSVRDEGIWETLSKEEIDSFAEDYKYLISVLDDDVILSMRRTSIFIRNHILGMKHGENVIENATIKKNGLLQYKGNNVFSPRARGIVSLESTRYNDGELTIVGRTRISRASGRCRLFAKVSGKESELIPVVITETVDEQLTFDGGLADKVEGFKVTIPISEGEEVIFVSKYNETQDIYHPKMDLVIEECDFDEKTKFVYKAGKVTGINHIIA